MSVARDLAFLLRNVGLENVFAGMLPATPDEVVMVRSTGGLEPLHTHGTAAYEQPRAQVLVRAKTEEVANARALIARAALRQTNITINGKRYLRIRPIDSIADLGNDEQQPPRRMFSFNVQILKEEE